MFFILFSMFFSWLQRTRCSSCVIFCQNYGCRSWPFCPLVFDLVVYCVVYYCLFMGFLYSCSFLLGLSSVLAGVCVFLTTPLVPAQCSLLLLVDLKCLLLLLSPLSCYFLACLLLFHVLYNNVVHPWCAFLCIYFNCSRVKFIILILLQLNQWTH